MRIMFDIHIEPQLAGLITIVSSHLRVTITKHDQSSYFHGKGKKSLNLIIPDIINSRLNINIDHPLFISLLVALWVMPSN